MAKNYISGNIPPEETKGGDCPTSDGEWGGFCRERSKWSQIRAVFISKPTDVLEGEPGSVIYAPVEIQNQTKWPWKRGCFIGLLDRQASSRTGELIVGDIPIDQDIRGM